MNLLIKIGQEERQFDAADERWITQQINHRRADGVTPCVKITIRQGDLDMLLATCGCPAAGGGGGRPPNSQEASIFELWKHRGLNAPNFSAGNLVAFLNQIKRSF